MGGYGQEFSAHGRAGHALSRPSSPWVDPFGPKWGKLKPARALYELIPLVNFAVSALQEEIVLN